MIKVKRIVNKKLLKSFHERSCVVCGAFGAEAHHIKSVGAGGNDIEEQS